MERLLGGCTLRVPKYILRGVGVRLRQYGSASEELEYFAESKHNKLLLSKFSVAQKCQNCIQVGDLSKFGQRLKLFSTSKVLEKPDAKVKLADETFDKLIKSTKLSPDTATFNILLEVYKRNNHVFVPSYFMDFMADNKCSPDLETFTLLFGAYCDQGKIAEAYKLLDFMKSSDIPMIQDIYASMVTGHSRSGDLEAAERVLDTMKADGVKVEQAVYTSLLCAYAERGLTDSITKVFKEAMESNVLDVLSSHVMLIPSMDTLSRFGHGSKVAEILSIITSQHLLHEAISDLHYLVFFCLCREELEAPLHIMECLSGANLMHDILVPSYVGVALAKNHLVQDLCQSHFTILGSTNNRIPESIISELLDMEFRRLQHIKSRGYPDKGDLVPHPPGDNWLSNMHFSLSLLKKFSPQIHLNFYYPLLARHCSDANIEEMINTFHMMVLHRVWFNSIMRKYIDKTFSNSSTTMSDWIQLQISKEADDNWLSKVFVFLLSHMEFEAAVSIFERVQNKEKFILDLNEFGGSVLNKNLRSLSTFSVHSLATLLKYGVPQQLFLKLIFFNNELNMTLMDELIAKECEGLKGYVISHFLSKLSSKVLMDPRIAQRVWTLIKTTGYNVTPDELEAMFLLISSTRASHQLKEMLFEVYNLLPQEKQNSFLVSCYYVSLLGYKGDLKMLDKFEELLEMDRSHEIPFLIWKKVVCAAYKHRSDRADDIMQKMIEAGYRPTRQMLIQLLYTFTVQKNTQKAEEILDNINPKSKEEDGLHYFLPILPMWAEHGEQDKIQELLDLILQRRTRNRNIAKGLQNGALQARVVAMIVNNNVEGAIRSTRTQVRFSRAYLKLIVQTLVCKEQSLEIWKEQLRNCGVSYKAFDTVVLFTYMHYGLHAKAREHLKSVDEFDTKEFQLNMAPPKGPIFAKLLKEWEAPVSSELLTFAPEGNLEQDDFKYCDEETDEITQSCDKPVM